jgi:hypothetical protein
MAAADNVRPTVSAALASWNHMIPRKLTVGETFAAIEAQVSIPGEQGTVGQWRFVALSPEVRLHFRTGKQDRGNLNARLQACLGIDAATDDT